ncbi:MAG: hypothetical protein HRU20_32020 [Pseudomonadales bacterium]|nr:hypothetical protein [Pseudomonadales bacterium]
MNQKLVNAVAIASGLTLAGFLGGCEFSFDSDKLSYSTIDKDEENQLHERFKIENYTPLANEEDNLDGVWVMIWADEFSSQGRQGYYPVAAEAAIASDVTLTTNRQSRTLCTISLADDVATTELVEYSSDCDLAEGALRYNIAEQRLSAGIDDVDLQVLGLKHMQGSMNAESGAAQTVYMRRVADSGTTLGDLSFTLGSDTDGSLTVTGFTEGENVTRIHIPDLPYEKTFSQSFVSIAANAGRLDIVSRINEDAHQHSQGIMEEEVVTETGTETQTLEVWDSWEYMVIDKLSANSSNFSIADNAVVLEDELVNGDEIQRLMEDNSLQISVGSKSATDFSFSFTGSDIDTGIAISGQSNLSF